MTDDVFTTRSHEPASQDTAAQEPEDPIAPSSPETADEGGDDGGGAGMLGPIELPSTGRLLVGLGGAVLALSTLLSWVEAGPDSFPNIAGVGTSAYGVGLAVFLVGLSLLLRSKSVAATLGMALGAFALTLISIILIGADNDLFGIGAWVGLAGAAVAILGALQLGFESDERPDLEFHPLPAALGAVLAVIASFWLDWVAGTASGTVGGLDFDVLFGFPILILAGIALVFAVELISVPQMVMEGRRQALLMIAQAAGVGIVVIAGSNVLATMVLGYDSFGSGPIVALVGGIMLTRSIKEA